MDLSAIGDVIQQVKGVSGNHPSKADALLRRGADECMAAVKQYRLPQDQTFDKGLLIAMDQYKTYRDLYVDYCEAMSLSGLPFCDAILGFIERIDNELHDASGKKRYGKRF